jgi:hypothetical protein
MNEKEILELFKREIAIYYTATPSQTGISKLQKIVDEIISGDFSEKEVIDYVEFVYRITRKIKDSGKRASVYYFVAILASENSWNRFMDLLDANREIQNETGTDEEEPTQSVSEIRFKGETYTQIGSTFNDTVDIFYNTETYRFVICNSTALVPQYTRLLKWNRDNPKRKITEELLEKFLRSKKLL